MDLALTMQKIAEEINGKFLEYSFENIIITVPVDRTRYQNVTGYLIQRPQGTILEFMSRVCEINDYIDPGRCWN